MSELRRMNKVRRKTKNDTSLTEDEQTHVIATFEENKDVKGFWLLSYPHMTLFPIIGATEDDEALMKAQKMLIDYGYHFLTNKGINVDRSVVLVKEGDTVEFHTDIKETLDAKHVEANIYTYKVARYV